MAVANAQQQIQILKYQQIQNYKSGDIPVLLYGLSVSGVPKD